MSTDDDAELEELRKKREERKRLQEEEERRENEERQRREEDRKQRKLEREKKAKEREEAHTKELEERKSRDQKEDERKRRREEREKQRLEEERLEKEAEEQRAKEREEKRKQDEEREEEGKRKQKEKEEQEALLKKDDTPARDTSDGARPGSRRKQKIDRMMTLMGSGAVDALDKIIVDDDMKEEALKLVNENNDFACDYFNKQETILTILKYISTVLLEPEKKTDDDLEDIIGRMEFAKEAISGNIPSLWRNILQPENRLYLEELFSILKHEAPTLPPINVTSFWKSVEFLLYRRSYEISNFMLTNKDVVPSFFRHLRDTKVMDVLFKLVEKEIAATPIFKEYDPKKAAEMPEEETRVWTDLIPDALLNVIGSYGRGEDTEWSDVEVENAAQFTTLVLEKFPECKLAHQFREASFCNKLVSRVYTPVSEMDASGFKYQSTLVGLLSFVNQLLKFNTNTSAYTTDTIPPLVSCLIYGPGGKKSKSDFIPVNFMKNWLTNKIPQFEFPIEQIPTKKGARSIGVMRVKCMQLFKAMFGLNFQCVDSTLRDNGTLLACVDMFFQNVDNNIMHNLVEEIIKTFLVREATSPITEILDATPTPLSSSSSSSISLSSSISFSSTVVTAPFSQYLLEECNLVERLIATLRTITLNKNLFVGFAPTKLDFEEPPPEPEKKPTSARNGKRTTTTSIPERDKSFLPPAFVGHVLNICKAITHASEKSVKLRHIVASCSGYHWGQTVMFHLEMRDSADLEWKKPFKKVGPQDIQNKDGERSVD